MRGIRQMILRSLSIVHSEPGPKYCFRCGAVNQPGAPYCVACGAQLPY